MNINKFIWGVAILLSSGLMGCEKELNIDAPGNLVPLTVDKNPALASISINDTQLHAETYGNPHDPMIVVLHGGPGSDYRYLLKCQEFASQGYFVVFYDQRGSGLSKRHPKNSYSIEVMLDDLSAVMAYYRSSEDQKIFLLGHSWGGMLATAYINSYPGSIDGVIIAEPGGFTWDQTLAYVNRSLATSFFSETLNDALYFDQFISGKEDEHVILDYRFMLLAAAAEAEESPTGDKGPAIFWRLGAVVQNALFEVADKEGFDWTTNLHQYETKVLFVYSERNKAYGLDHAQNVSAPYPNVELFQVEDSGHDMISYPPGWEKFYPKALTYFNTLK